MKKQYSILLLFLFILILGCNKKETPTQNSISSEDSLVTYLSLANDMHLPIKFKQKYNQRALAIILSQKDDSINRINLFKIANRYYNMSNWEEFRKISALILLRSKSSLDTINIAKAYTYLGDYNLEKSVSDSAFYYYNKAEKLYVKVNDYSNLAKIQINKANLQYNENDYFNSEIGVFKALRTLKLIKSNGLIYNSYNLLGILYNERDEYDKALEFHNKALVALQDKSIPQVFQYKASSLNNIGYVYLNLKNYEKARDYFKSGLEQQDLFIDNPSLYAMLLDNFAFAKLKLKDNNELPGLFYKALKIRDSLNITSGIIINKAHLSEYFVYKKDTLKAIEYAKEALSLSRHTNRYRSILESLKQMGAVDPKNASIYSKEYIIIHCCPIKKEAKLMAS